MKKQKPPMMIFRSSVMIGGGRVFAVGEQGREQLAPICEVLNSTDHPALRESLRRIVETWQDSGPDLEKMMYGDLDLFSEVQSSCSVRWTPQNDGRATLTIAPNYRQNQEQKMEFRDGEWYPTAEAEALVLFYLLTVNPEWDKLAGPCARCGKYFVKKRASQRVYCSRPCGNAATAAVRTRERLKADHDKKIHRARSVVAKWHARKKSSQVDWAVWLRHEAPDISPKALTRWINQGEVPKPTDAAKAPISNPRRSR